MSRIGTALAGAAAALAVAVGCVLAVVLVGGISARAEPTGIEAWVARRLRHLAVPVEARRTVNPVSLSESVLAAGRAHWADHCAICHGNDGRGDTAIGRGLYPRAPDMRFDATQALSDGELFFIIENGVRFTGMPGWGGDGRGRDDETWHLVHFIRHLPDLSPEELLEMERLNPRTPAEVEDREETRAFLEGGGEPEASEPGAPVGAESN